MDFKDSPIKSTGVKLDIDSNPNRRLIISALKELAEKSNGAVCHGRWMYFVLSLLAMFGMLAFE